jgi:hypothetical protein
LSSNVKYSAEAAAPEELKRTLPRALESARLLRELSRRACRDGGPLPRAPRADEGDIDDPEKTPGSSGAISAAHTNANAACVEQLMVSALGHTGAIL